MSPSKGRVMKKNDGKGGRITRNLVKIYRGNKGFNMVVHAVIISFDLFL